MGAVGSSSYDAWRVSFVGAVAVVGSSSYELLMASSTGTKKASNGEVKGVKK